MLWSLLVKGDEFDELKSLLLQVDQSLDVSQLLLMGTFSSCTLSKRQEMLDRSPIPEPLIFPSSEGQIIWSSIG
jgi:hypothetical protein